MQHRDEFFFNHSLTSPNCRGRHAGFTLLESLLVAALIAVLFLASFARYHQYHSEAQLTAIQNNVSIMMEALNRFYRAQECQTPAGVFPYVDEDLFARMKEGDYLKSTELKPTSLVTAYEARVTDTGQLTKKDKHIYQLNIIAHFANDQSLGAYQKALNAGEENTMDQTLTWFKLPSRITSSHDNWMLNANGDLFKQQETYDNDSQCY